MAEVFTVGDIVKLRSGGPKMTVEKVEDDDVVQCVWFDEMNVTQNKGFPANALERD
jgi:uncharacterized protein YodC (DUF2158 family)